MLQLILGSEMNEALWIMPLAVLMGGAFQALNYWNTRTKHFSRLSIARVVGSALGVVISLGFGFAGLNTGVHMIVAVIIGQAVATIALGIQIFRDHGKYIMGSLSWRRSVELLVIYKGFPTYYTASNLVNTLSAQLPIFLLGAFFSISAVGFYSS